MLGYEDCLVQMGRWLPCETWWFCWGPIHLLSGKPSQHLNVKIGTDP